MRKLTNRQNEIIDIVGKYPSISISQIAKELNESVSIPTLNRDVAALVDASYLIRVGQGRTTSYKISSSYKLFSPVDLDDYFNSEQDKRSALDKFNDGISLILKDTDIFTKNELSDLEALQKQYQNNIINISPTIYQKEMERLTIEMSWKSSQIEGNTYSLLETERLFLEHKEAIGKSKAEATMLLNHKECLNFILKNKNIGERIKLSSLEEMHSVLIKDLNVSRNLRSRTVGITGTVYKPLDNIYQIKEAVEIMCNVINSKSNVFEKALLAVVLISYIQPFEDGNKRTGRMASNAILISGEACPLSYRSVDALEYKKAMLLFYEQNNISAFKKLFIQQVEFAVKNYFQ